MVASVLEGEGEGKERSDRSLCKYRSISRGVKGKENIEEDRRDREDRRIRAGDRFSFAPSSDLFLRRPSPPDRFSNEFREGGGKREGEIEREREKGAAGQETRGGREGAFEIKGSVGHPPRTSGQLK